MIKLLSLLTALTLGSTGVISVATYNQQTNVPDWINSMIENNPNKINVGYNHYSLINKKEDKNDSFKQRDWINLNQNKNLYLYLPEAKNIDEAIQNIILDDSAVTWTIGIQTPVTWTKINNTTYTNNKFITQDTTVSGIALLKNDKFNQIKNSTKFTTLTSQEKERFETYGSLPASRGNKKQDWWNANHWETLLSKEKNLDSSLSKDQGKKFSQLDLYDRWINQNVIGMNVPLSLMAENSFTLKQTKINHVFQFESTPQQIWIDNNGNTRNIFTPHWGMTLKITNKQETIFQTPQLINLNDTFKANTIANYLNEKEYFSFNSQETTKFKNNYLVNSKTPQTFNNYLFLIIPLISYILLFNLILSQNWIKASISKIKNKIQVLNNEKRKKSI